MKPAIAWVDVLLNRWGRWAIRTQSGALGYAKMSMLAGAADGEAFAGSEPPPDVTGEDFEDVSRIIESLRIIGRVCIVQVYQIGAGKSDVYNARVIGISRQGLEKYIHQAQRDIARELSHKKHLDKHQTCCNNTR